MSERPVRDPSDGKEGVSRYIRRRLGTILRRGSSKRSSVLGTGEPSAEQSAKTTTSKAAPAAITATTQGGPAPPTREQPTVYGWSDIQQERARALFAKYGLTLEPEEWMSPRTIPVERVEKPIRMRVRRICHRCQTTFGVDRVCSNCQHVRCKSCPRYPPKKSKPEEKGKEKATATDTIPTEARGKRKHAPLTIPSRTGGQDRIFQPPRQRVRRTCHRCGTLFHGKDIECVTCKHIRCRDCPRDPAKRDKYPDGYPGDADPPNEPPTRVWRKARRRLRYYCHQCNTMYLPGTNTCSQCGQEKCVETIRDPPKRVKPPSDPEVLRRVEERLTALTLDR